MLWHMTSYHRVRSPRSGQPLPYNIPCIDTCCKSEKGWRVLEQKKKKDYATGYIRGCCI